ncbi:nucleotide-diphospho-sugar transferase [Paraphoma chrysanthemicola]|uniref:Nucleotide-diphospho-sugar transferase n=1 Tax=Paraphoma chrysanthemicola TaxID=798071 RepID=A0A8K0VYY0_9PLEO|nr:nucleotide-diphospho-sugar transferase [Paraphoma chrysanthemicola]
MRRGVTIFILVTVVVLGFAVHSVWTLLGLLIATGREDAILRGELPAPNSGTINERPQLIPKIIHQTYINASIPDVWKAPQQSCLDLHPDYEYKLWTDKKAREFIAAEYPWFLETFDGYPYPIQRADAIRYFVLHHFGGIYIDLDDGCNRSLDPLLAYPAWVRRTVPTGISNDAMGSIPRHPFFLKAIDSLTDYNRRWPLPYITVMASTGPLYLSIIWRHYNNANPEGNDRVRILFPDEYNNHPWSFFTHHLGNSWHRTDVKVIFWLARHWVFVTFVGFALGFSLLGLLYKIFILNRQPGSPRLSPKLRYLDRFAYTRLPFYRRISSKDFELEDRHEV